MQIVNITGYKFVNLNKERLIELKASLKEKAISLEIKGTILLSREGINLYLAGLPEHITLFKYHLVQIAEFSDLEYKESTSDFVPFKRMLIKIKEEIITFGQDINSLEARAAPYISPELLKRWYDENHDMLVLDTRNRYETELGKFENAIDLELDSFTEFSKALDKLPVSAKSKPIITYCTGGIRCEKAANYMLKAGFKEVYQLQGGILNYFAQCGGDHYEGDCFVFDDRVALDAALQPSKKVVSTSDKQLKDETA